MYYETQFKCDILILVRLIAFFMSFFSPHIMSFLTVDIAAALIFKRDSNCSLLNQKLDIERYE